MMTDCFKFFLATVSVAFAICVFGGCDAFKTLDGMVDLRKVSDRKASMREFYDRIEVVCLDNVPENTASAPVLSGLSVTGDRFFFQQGDRAILSYRQDGRFADSLNPGVPIKAYAVHVERILDILSGKEVYEYRIPGFSFQQKMILEPDDPEDSDAIPVNLIRLPGGRMMMFPVYKGNKDYWGTYYFDSNKYYVAPGIKGEATECVAEKVRLIRYGDSALALFPYSGQLWELGDFIGHFLWPDFKPGKRDTLEFLFAQVTDEKVYYSILLNGAQHLLIFNRADRKYVCVRTTREGLSLPLGVIRDGINYYYCPSADLPRYVARDLLDSDSIAAMDRAVKGGLNVMIKYHLR